MAAAICHNCSLKTVYGTLSRGLLSYTHAALTPTSNFKFWLDTLFNSNVANGTLHYIHSRLAGAWSNTPSRMGWLR